MNIALSCGVKKVGYVSSIAALGRHSTQKVINENCHFKKTIFFQTKNLGENKESQN